MEKEIFKKVIEKVSDIEVGEFADFGTKNYSPVKVSVGNFREIILDRSANAQKVVFVDGGNAEIFSAPNISFQIIRVVAVCYKNNVRVFTKKYEHFCLITPSTGSTDNNMNYRCEFFSDMQTIEFNSFDKNIVQGNKRAEISSVANIARRFIEIKLAESLVSDLQKNDVIVMDGSLQALYTGEERLLGELYSSAAKKNIVITGLSKTSRLMTNKGFPFAAALSGIAPEGSWYYFPVAEFEDPKRVSDIYFIKLHPRSEYIFMLDIHKGIAYPTDEIMSLLSSLSFDPVFLGYPYGAIESDRLARIENIEKEYLKQRFMAEAGKEWKRIAGFARTIDAHSVLDNIGY